MVKVRHPNGYRHRATSTCRASPPASRPGARVRQGESSPSPAPPGWPVGRTWTTGSGTTTLDRPSQSQRRAGGADRRVPAGLVPFLAQSASGELPDRCRSPVARPRKQRDTELCGHRGRSLPSNGPELSPASASCRCAECPGERPGLVPGRPRRWHARYLASGSLPSRRPHGERGDRSGRHRPPPALGERSIASAKGRHGSRPHSPSALAAQPERRWSGWWPRLSTCRRSRSLWPATLRAGAASARARPWSSR